MGKRAYSRTKKRKIQAAIKNLALLLLTIAVFLTCVELVLRLTEEKRFAPAILPQPQVELYETTGMTEEEIAHDARLNSTDTARFTYPSSNPLLPWEHVPNSKVWFAGAPVTINEYGYRGRAHELNKSKYRILVLGDSFTFGYGVGDNETIPHYLQEELGEEYEVLNFGVNGYNTLNELELLKSKGLLFNPDIVLVGFFLNDLFYEQVEQDSTYCNILLQSAIGRRYNVFQRNVIRQYSKLKYRQTFSPNNAHLSFYLPYYENPLDVGCFERVAKEFKAIEEKEGFKLIFIFIPDFHSEKINDTLLKEMEKVFIEVMEKHGINYISLANLSTEVYGEGLSATIGGHPNRNINEKIAKEIGILIKK